MFILFSGIRKLRFKPAYNPYTEPSMEIFSYHEGKVQFTSLYQGPVVQSVISLTSSLRVILLTVLADSLHNILIFFAEKCE